MLDAGGASNGSTNWNATDVKAMWAAVQNHNTDTYFDVVVKGWQATADLLSEHISRVSTYRDNLATAWSPQKSAASAAYIDRLNQLIDHLNDTLMTTSTNITAFRTAASTLATAQVKLKPILDQYEANEAANLSWQTDKAAADKAAAAAPSSSPTPSPSPSPSPVPSKPPVSSAQQEQLNYQARTIMFDLSASVLSSKAAMQAPKPYTPEGAKKPIDQGGGDSDGDGNTFAPFVSAGAAPASASTRSAGSTSTSGHTVSSIAPSTTIPATQNPIGAAPGVNPVTTTPGAGPILGGVAPSTVVSPPGVGSPLPGGVPTPGTISGVPPVGLPGILPRSDLLPSAGFLPNGGKVVPGGFVKPSPLGTPSGRMAMPSGGVIGATPGSGVIGQVPGAGRPGSRYGSGSRVNPVGGVIGERGAMPVEGANGRPGGSAKSVGVVHSGGPEGSARSAAGNTLGQNGRPVRKDERQDAATYWDPDNPWITDEGVDPVLMPPPEAGPIDPGPAIGYSR